MKNFIELVKDNPNLPVYAWVDYEVVGDNCGLWLGDMGSAFKTKIVSVEQYGEDRIVEYDNRDYIYDYWAGEDEFMDKTDDELDEMVESLPWRECILVYVGTPDSLYK